MAQQGFVYEENACKLLKTFGLSDGITAGASHTRPDLMLVYKGVSCGCELKITDASAGSLVLKYNPKTKKWGFGDIKDSDSEKLFIKGVAIRLGALDTLDKNWNDVTPYKLDKEYQDDKWKAMTKGLTSRDMYARDGKAFPEQNKKNLSAVMIEDYYAKKDCHYVNVGTHGFYLFGSKNPYKLKDVPRFSDCAEAGWRARVQYKGSGNYQFTFEMSFRMKKKSPFNIAPISKSSVTILKEQLNISCFPDL